MPRCGGWKAVDGGVMPGTDEMLLCYCLCDRIAGEEKNENEGAKVDQPPLYLPGCQCACID